jgi:cell division protease FtsH
MVTIYGLSEKVGNLTYYDSSGQNEMGFTKPYSEQTAELIDKEISNIIEEQYQRAVKLLQENKDKLTELAEVLLEKEVIFKDNLEKIFGKRAFEKEELLEIPKKQPESVDSESTKLIPDDQDDVPEEEVKDDLLK